MKPKIFGILPMAGEGSRIQPIGFSKELYPVVYNGKHFAISEFTIKSMVKAGADEIKLVINPNKMDIAKYYSQKDYFTSYYFYNSPSLPESCLYPIDNLHDNDICLFGLPDTLFSPSTGYQKIVSQIRKGADICLGLFKVDDSSKYDSVKIDKSNNVKGVLVKQSPPLSSWIWGIWGAKVSSLRKLKTIINSQKTNDEKLLGVGFNDICKDKSVKFKAIKSGETYFDVGTMDSVIRANNIIENINF